DPLPPLDHLEVHEADLADRAPEREPAELEEVPEDLRQRGRLRARAGATRGRGRRLGHHRFWVSSAARMPFARSSVLPTPQKWRNRIRGSSPVMCWWMATMSIPAPRSALSTLWSSASSIAKSPSTTAFSSEPTNAAQVLTPM